MDGEIPEGVKLLTLTLVTSLKKQLKTNKIMENSQNLKNEELEKLFKTQLESGSPVLIGYGEPSTKGYQSIFFAQKRNGLRQGTVVNDSWNQELRGWNTGERIVRAVFSMNLEHIKKLSKEQQKAIKEKFSIGNTFPDRIIMVTQDCVKAYETETARLNPNTGETITHNESPVYEHTSIIPLSEYVTDTLLVSDKVKVETSIPTEEKEFAFM